MALSREIRVRLQSGLLLFFLVLSAAAAEATETSKNATVTSVPTERGTLKEDQAMIESGAATRKETEREMDPDLLVLGKSTQGRRGGKTQVKEDSYIDALRHSRYRPNSRDGLVRLHSNPIAVSANRREYVPGPVYVPQTAYGTIQNSAESNYHADKIPASASSSNTGFSPSRDPSKDSFSISASDSYSLPTKTSIDFQRRPSSLSSSYDSPRIVYGAPQKPYQHHQNSYGDYSGNSYLPPQPAYGAPSGGLPYGLPEVHVSELPSIDFSWPFALKLNIFTLAKILLKLVIFKMIVKFIAVICLLLFIPKLKIIKKGNKGEMMDDDDDESRRFLPEGSLSLERLNALTAFVLGAYEEYERRNNGRSNSNETCTDPACHLRASFVANDSWSDYGRLLKSYISEEVKEMKS